MWWKPFHSFQLLAGLAVVAPVSSVFPAGKSWIACQLCLSSVSVGQESLRAELIFGFNSLLFEDLSVSGHPRRQFIVSSLAKDFFCCTTDCLLKLAVVIGESP
jgi:hypothetical protein